MTDLLLLKICLEVLVIGCCEHWGVCVFWGCVFIFAFVACVGGGGVIAFEGTTCGMAERFSESNQMICKARMKQLRRSMTHLEKTTVAEPTQEPAHQLQQESATYSYRYNNMVMESPTDTGLNTDIGSTLMLMYREASQDVCDMN